nr:unnamed protein product [Haemonchus contortus]
MRMPRWARGWTRLDRVGNEGDRTAMQTEGAAPGWFGPQRHPIREAMEFGAQGCPRAGRPPRRVAIDGGIVSILRSKWGQMLALAAAVPEDAADSGRGDPCEGHGSASLPKRNPSRTVPMW